MPKSKWPTHVEPRLAKIEEWARDGATMEEIAKRLGLHVATLYAYSNEHRELDHALRMSRIQADYRVEGGMYQRATGMPVEEVHEEWEPHPTDPSKMVLVSKRVVKKHLAPDVSAGKFWLTNRQPERWQERRELGVGGIDGGPVEISFVEPELDDPEEDLATMEDQDGSQDAPDGPESDRQGGSEG